MDAKRKLKDLLSQYIDEHKKLKETYKQNRVIIAIYEELIKALQEKENQEGKLFVPILLNTIY